MYYYIDYRERELIESLEKNNIEHIVVNLPIADVWLTTKQIELDNYDQTDVQFVIERKTYSDLYSSVIDGRYNEQKQRLLSAFDPQKIVYILERAMMKDQRIMNIINGSQISIVFNNHMNLLYSLNVQCTMQLIDKLAKFTPSSSDVTVHAIAQRRSAASNVYINQLCAIPGVAIKIATAIKEQYPTLKTLINALESNGVQALDSIRVHNRRIPTVAQRIYNELMQ